MSIHIDDYIQFPRDRDHQTKAFQEALIHLNADGGGKLLLGPRQYDIETVTLCANLILEGEGRATVVRKLPDVGRHMLIASDKICITIRDITFDGNEAEQPAMSGKSCVRLTDCDEIRIQDCWFTRGGNRAVDLRKCRSVIFSGNFGLRNGLTNIDGNGGATLHVDRHGNDPDSMSEDVIAVGNILGHAGDSLLGLPSTNRAAVVANIFRGARSYGQEPMRTEAGVSLVSNQDSVCVGNVFHELNLAGSYRDRQYQPCENILIANNACRSSRWKCELNHASRAILVSANTMVDGGQMECSGDGGSDVVLDGNFFSTQDAMQYGIKYSGTGPENWAITDTVMYGFQQGIRVNNTVPPGIRRDNIVKGTRT